MEQVRRICGLAVYMQVIAKISSGVLPSVCAASELLLKKVEEK